MFICLMYLLNCNIIKTVTISSNWHVNGTLCNTIPGTTGCTTYNVRQSREQSMYTRQ